MKIILTELIANKKIILGNSYDQRGKTFKQVGKNTKYSSYR